MPPHFAAALHEVGRSAARDPGKYAVTRVQVRGAAGELCGTDGKQALAWGGFQFPFGEDVLVPAVPLFGSKELAGEAAVSAGLAGEWLYVVIGPWQVWLWVDREGRFPDVHAAAPRACPTRVAFDDRDASDLLRDLPRLPGADGEAKPVTLDLGSTVAVRARDDRTEDTSEVRLGRSSAAGPPARVVVGRDHLGRALALGFRELRVSTPERPLAFRRSDRLFLCATLDPALVVPPSGDPDDPGWDPDYARLRRAGAGSPAGEPDKAAGESLTPAALAVAVAAGRWWLARKGSPWQAAGAGLAAGATLLAGGPMARTALVVLLAVHRLLAATDALGDSAEALDRA